MESVAEPRSCHGTLLVARSVVAPSEKSCSDDATLLQGY